jgi:Zn-dependent alcohol dehydrogenase
MGSRKQKGVFVYEVGMPVRLGEREVPSPKQGEVLVKVTSTQRTSSILTVQTLASFPR